MAGIPLSEYIRRRRMSLAAIDLQSGKEKIIDIGMKYGYSSPTAFKGHFKVCMVQHRQRPKKEERL